MGFRLEVLLFILASCISLALFLAMRTGAVRGGFVALWLAICAAMISLPFLESFYKYLAELMGLNFALDMLYMFAIIFLMLYVFYLTAKLQRTMDIVETLMARAAIVESYLDLGSNSCPKARNTENENDRLE